MERLERNQIEADRISKSKSSGIAQISSQIMFLMGAFMIVFGLIFMLINLSKSDSIIMIWLPIMISGVALIVMGLLFKGKKEDLKNRNNRVHRRH